MVFSQSWNLHFSIFLEERDFCLLHHEKLLPLVRQKKVYFHLESENYSSQHLSWKGQTYFSSKVKENYSGFKPTSRSQEFCVFDSLKSTKTTQWIPNSVAF